MAPCSLRSFLYPHFGTASGPRNCQFWAGLDEGPAFHRQDPGGLGEFSMPRIATESVENSFRRWREARPGDYGGKKA